MGLVKADYPADQQPGWQPGGWGLHGDDGNLYWHGGDRWRNAKFLQKFQQGDVIGCGVNNVKKEIFFTRNGLYVDVAFRGVDTSGLVPAVALGSPGETVVVNLGASPFLWNMDLTSMEYSVYNGKRSLLLTIGCVQRVSMSPTMRTHNAHPTHALTHGRSKGSA